MYNQLVVIVDEITFPLYTHQLTMIIFWDTKMEMKEDAPPLHFSTHYASDNNCQTGDAYSPLISIATAIQGNFLLLCENLPILITSLSDIHTHTVTHIMTATILRIDVPMLSLSLRC